MTTRGKVFRCPFPSPFWWLHLCLMAAALQPALVTTSRAQASGGIDVTGAYPQVWRGITTSSAGTVEPGAWLAWTFGRAELAGGVWSSMKWRDLDGAGQGLGDRSRLTEVDWWTQVTWILPDLQFSLGGLRSDFRDTVPRGLIEARDDLTEVYVQLWTATERIPVGVDAIWYQPLSEGSGYGELTLSREVPLVPMWPPMPFGDLVLGVSSGFSGRRGTNDRSSAFADGGVTHIDAFAAGTLSLLASTYAQFTIHHQWNMDPVTRSNLKGSLQPRKWWFEYGLSIPFHLERRR